MRAFEVLFRNAFVFFALAAIASAPLALYMWHAATTTAPSRFSEFVERVVSFVLLSLCEATIVHATFQTLRRRPASIVESAARGFRRFGAVIVASLLRGLTVGVGMLLLLVPGLIWAVTFFVTIPACVVEQLAGPESMSRSSDLTRGCRWQIFAAYAVIETLSFVVYFVLATTLRHPATVTLYTIVDFTWSTFVLAYNSVLVTIVYHDLRVAKEGIDIDHLAAVFD